MDIRKNKEIIIHMNGQKVKTKVSICHASTVVKDKGHYDIISGDKHTRAWIHKYRRFIGEFQEIKPSK